MATAAAAAAVSCSARRAAVRIPTAARRLAACKSEIVASRRLRVRFLLLLLLLLLRQSPLQLLRAEKPSALELAIVSIPLLLLLLLLLTAPKDRFFSSVFCWIHSCKLAHTGTTGSARRVASHNPSSCAVVRCQCMRMQNRAGGVAWRRVERSDREASRKENRGIGDT